MEASFFTRHPLLKDALSLIVFIVCVVIGTIFINSFVFRSFNVVGPSMETTMHTGDRLIVNRLPITWSNVRNQQYMPERGQVIVFQNPRYTEGMGDEYIVKRVIAFEGERVTLQDGSYTVFNDESPDGFDPDQVADGEPSSPTSGDVNIVVPADEIFVSGDNREGNTSFDSRNGLGTIPLYNVIGPVSLRIFPITDIRTF